MINSYDVWSPNASELCYKGNIPERLSQLLSSILVKEGGKKTSTALTVLNCIRQDIIYSLSIGRKRTKIMWHLGVCLKGKT